MAVAWRLCDGRERPVAWCPCSSPCPRAERTARRLSALFQCRVPLPDRANSTTHPHSHLSPQNCRWRPSRLVRRTASIDATPSQAPRPRRERKVPVLLQQARLTSKCHRWQAVRPAQRRVRRLRGRTNRSDHRPLGPSGLRAKSSRAITLPHLNLWRLLTPLSTRLQQHKEATDDTHTHV